MRWLMRAPVWLYRARLGFLLGSRFLMIEHRGRTSGRLYRTVVEVVGGSERDERLVVSGFGPRADWYLNLRANGLVAIWLGSRRRGARVRFIEPDEAAQAIPSTRPAIPGLPPCCRRSWVLAMTGPRRAVWR